MKDKQLYDETMSFADKYNIETEKYTSVSVTSLPFSVYVINGFRKKGILTVADLLNSTPSILNKIRGFGKNRIDKVEAFCAKLNDDDSIATAVKDKNRSEPAMVFIKYRNEIAAGDFSLFESCVLSEAEKTLLQKYKEAYEVLGDKLAFDCISSAGKIIPVIRMFADYNNRMKRHIEIWSLANSLPKSRTLNKAIGYINAFTLDDNERFLLKKMCVSEESSILSLAGTDKVDETVAYLLLKRFLKWCSFDLKKETEELFATLYSNERIRTVVQMRARKQTLEQIGAALNITRERVRQIETKAKRLFARLHGRIRIITKIAAERNGDSILTPAEIAEYCGTNTTELIYFLQSYKSANYTYDRQLDVFVVGDDSISGRVQNYLESLPDLIKVSQLESLLNDAAEEVDIPTEILKKAFLETYRITGEVYHRYSLSLATIYTRVLETHYPTGFRAYDAEEIQRFREIIFNEYGDVGLPPNDRALTARVTSICILCGRGIYRLKKKDYLPKALANKICEYIETNENSIFLTNTIFSVFEDELTAVGIDNKYFLQGVLHELFGDKFVFRRDYISKDVDVTSVYSAVVEFIKKSNFPVSKTQIQGAFPGITEIVINLSVGDPNVLNYFGEYLHASKLNILVSEKAYLFNVVEKLVCDGEAHHGKELYAIISSEKSEILTRNAAMSPFSAFSIIEYLFRGKFQFSRPYIARNGIEIGRPAERLYDLIYSNDEVTVSEISEFARDNHFHIQSLLDYVNGCNDEFFLINNDLMVRIARTGIDDGIATQIDNIIADAISETTPIKNLSVWSELPRINIPWTEWLIYSVITKWGKRTMAATSSNQFRLSVPLVAPVGKYDPTAFRDIDRGETTVSFVADDLSDIDSLLEEMMDDDFLSGL